MKTCTNLKCKNEYAEGTGHSLEMDGPEICCSYKCIEELKRGGFNAEGMSGELYEKMMEDVKRFLPEGSTVIGGFIVRPPEGSDDSSEDSGEECNCEDCINDRKEQEEAAVLVKKYFGNFVGEIAEPSMKHVAQVCNSHMTKLGILSGDLLVSLDTEADSDILEINRSFCKSQSTFKAQMSSKRGRFEVYIFAPVCPREDVLCYVLRTQRKDLNEGQESKAALLPYIDAVEACLSSSSSTDFWIKTAEEIVQRVGIEVLGPRAVGHRVVAEDVDINPM